MHPTPAAPAPAAAPPSRARFPTRAATALALIALGVAAGGAATHYWDELRKTPEAKAPEAKPEEDHDSVHFAEDRWAAAGIRVEPAQVGPLRDFAWRTGRVALNEDRVAHLSPPVEGIVREVPARLGQTVRAGDVLAIIDSKEVGQAKLELAKARVALLAAREHAAWSKTTLANAAEMLKALADGRSLADIDKQFASKPIGEIRKQLFTASSRRSQAKVQYDTARNSSGTVPEAAVRNAAAEADAAEAAYKALTEELRFQVANQQRQAELRLKEAETTHDVAVSRMLMFGYTRPEVDACDPIAEGAKASYHALRSPFAGTVIDKHAVMSGRVGPQAEMFVVADLGTVWVQADVFEPDLPLLHGLTAGRVPFRSPAVGISEREAAVLYTGDLIDRSSRASTLTATAPNPDRDLKPGMFVEVGLPRGSNEEVRHVPAAAVQRIEKQTFVFVHVKDDEFRKTPVELGRTAGDRVEVRAGLKPEDKVVVAGGFLLKSELLKDLLTGE